MDVDPRRNSEDQPAGKSGQPAARFDNTVNGRLTAPRDGPSASVQKFLTKVKLANAGTYSEGLWTSARSAARRVSSSVVGPENGFERSGRGNSSRSGPCARIKPGPRNAIAKARATVFEWGIWKGIHAAIENHLPSRGDELRVFIPKDVFREPIPSSLARRRGSSSGKLPKPGQRPLRALPGRRQREVAVFPIHLILLPDRLGWFVGAS